MVMEFRIAGPPAYDNRLKTRLQSAVQSVQWTYSLFWQLCPQKGILVWGEGYYNGAIKTRKTVQPMEVTTEEAALNRSEQLRELYNSLAGGDHHQMIMNHHQQPPTTRRPSAALLPEDLTESEWFYLMCFSFSFAHGVGLVGEAYEKQRHVWLTGADEVDSTVFTRAILAKSAHVQTVACIPVLNGVVELGTTENVEEDFEFVKHVKSLFVMDQNSPILPLDLKPALSAHSSNTTLSPQMSAMIYKSLEPTNTTCQIDEEDLEDKDEEDQEDDDDDEDDDEDDDDEACDGKDEEGENGSDSDADTGHISGVQNPGCVADELYESELVSMPNDLLQLDMPEDIRVGSPNDGSNNLNLGFQFLAVGQACDPSGSIIAESTPRWPDLSLQNQTSLQIHASGAPQVKESTQEDTHYSTTVSTILQNQSSRCSYSYPEGSHHAICSTQSSFSTWTPMHHRNLHRHRVAAEADAQNSQWILKHIVFTVPFLHSNTKSGDGAASDSVASRLRKGTSQDELSANHVLAERRRREKLNERFIILRSLVPVVTKMDKASILGDTIEYLKQLRQKIQDLEARASVTDGSKTVGKVCSNKRKIRVVEGRGGGGGKAKVVEAEVEVSIIESDALVELHCPHNEGLLLDVMKRLREFGIEITTVQSSLHSGTCTAEIRAKVKEKANGNKVSIMQVKKAINQIINSSI